MITSPGVPAYLLFVMLVFTPAAGVFGDDALRHSGSVTALPPERPLRQEAMPIQKIFDAAESLKDEEVVIEGAFRGWKGKCPSSFMLTRSDWALEDETGCIYISGQLPGTVSPSKPNGERVRVRGRVVANNKGRVIVKAMQSMRVRK